MVLEPNRHGWHRNVASTCHFRLSSSISSIANVLCAPISVTPEMLFAIDFLLKLSVPFHAL